MQRELKLARSSRGFASMDAEKQREIARKGGRSVPNEKRSFSQNHKLASEAGRKGGQSSHINRPRADREHMESHAIHTVGTNRLDFK
jgi:general stress protein YciG